MPHPLSNDLRERVVAFVEAGNSCNEAARHFDTSVSFAVNLMSLLRETGSIEPRPMGGKRHGKLDPAEAFLLAFVERTPDVTMPELATALLAEKGIVAAPQSLSRWLIKKGFSFKKTLRASEQDRPELAKARAEWKQGRQPIMREQRGRLSSSTRPEPRPR
jgi:transposase